MTDDSELRITIFKEFLAIHIFGTENHCLQEKFYALYLTVNMNVIPLTHVDFI